MEMCLRLYLAVCYAGNICPQKSSRHIPQPSFLNLQVDTPTSLHTLSVDIGEIPATPAISVASLYLTSLICIRRDLLLIPSKVGEQLKMCVENSGFPIGVAICVMGITFLKMP